MAAVKGVPEQRELIVRAARRAIVRDGLGALRIRAVAAEVGLSHASLLHYFRSKDELLQAVLDSAIRGDIAGPLVEDAPAAGPPAQLRRLLEGMTRPPEDEGDDHHALILELLHHGHEVRAPLLAYTTIWHDYLVELIRRGQADGHFRTDLEAGAAAGIVIEMSLGLKTRIPLPERLDRDAIDQLLSLLRP